MQETVNWSSKLTFSRERCSGIAPVNVRNVGESHKIIRQTDSALGVDAREGPGGFPQGLISPLPIRPLPHDLCHGCDSPCWLLAYKQTNRNRLRHIENKLMVIREEWSVDGGAKYVKGLRGTNY